MIVRSLVLLVLLGGALGLRERLDTPASVTSAEQLSQFPVQLGQWSGRDVPLDADIVKLAAVDDHLNREYVGGGREVGLYVGYYRSQRQGESLHSPLFCLPGSGWAPMANRSVPLTDAPGAPRARELVVERGMSRLLVVYWYQTVRRVTGSEYGRKLFLMSDALAGRTDVALVRVITPIDFRDARGELNAIALARPFAAQVLPEVQHRLFRE